MADDNDTFGEGSNYFSSFKVGGVKQNIYGPSVKGVPNPGVRIEPKTDAQGKQLYDLDGQPSVNIIQQPAFIDGSDALANQGFTISFQSVINKKTTVFKAFVTAFNETYNSNWTSEEVYGRADPIYLFKNTTRNITLAFEVPASTEGEAYENLTKTQELIQKLYPAYTNVQRAQTIAQSPLVRMKVINLTQRAAGDYGANLGVSPQLMNVTPDASDGILGIIKNVSINHHLDDPNTGVFEVDNGTILPKLIEIQIEFGAIHEMPLAQREEWDAEAFEQGFSQFPYGLTSPAGRSKEEIKREIDEAYSTWSKNYQDERELEQERELGDQAMENAEARYAGLFGKARFNKDKKRLQNGSIKNDEKRRYLQEAVIGEEMTRGNADSSDYGTYAENNSDFYDRAEYDAYGEIIN